MNIKKKEQIAAMLKKIGDDITATLTVVGEIKMEQNVKYNVLTNQYSLKISLTI